MMNQGKAGGKTSSSTKVGSSKDKGVNALVMFQWGYCVRYGLPSSGFGIFS